MIYTLTLNPAVDYYVSADKITIGEINHSYAESLQIGGKGINASIILNELGVQSVALGYLAGFTGDAVKRVLDKKGIANDFVFLDNGITRINVKIKTNCETDINGEGPEIDYDAINALLPKFDQIKDGDILLLAGSIPNSMSHNFYANIVKKMQNKDVKIVVDSTKSLLTNTLRYKPFLIKPNDDELGEIFNVTISSFDDAIFYAKKLQDMGAQNVIVSMGSKGAIMVDFCGVTHIVESPKGHQISSVGAGDSMVAGFLAGFVETNNLNKALKLGIAAGAATAFSAGLADRNKIMSVYKLLPT